MTNAFHYQNTFNDSMASEFQEILSVIDEASSLLLQNNSPMKLQSNKILALNNGE